jgi:hypothetical protein
MQAQEVPPAVVHAATITVSRTVATTAILRTNLSSRLSEMFIQSWRNSRDYLA